MKALEEAGFKREAGAFSKDLEAGSGREIDAYNVHRGLGLRDVTAGRDKAKEGVEAAIGGLADAKRGGNTEQIREAENELTKQKALQAGYEKELTQFKLRGAETQKDLIKYNQELVDQERKKLFDIDKSTKRYKWREDSLQKQAAAGTLTEPERAKQMKELETLKGDVTRQSRREGIQGTAALEGKRFPDPARRKRHEA